MSSLSMRKGAPMSAARIGFRRVGPGPRGRRKATTAWARAHPTAS